MPFRIWAVLFVLFLPSLLRSQEPAAQSWKGVLHNDAGISTKNAVIHLVGKKGELVSGVSADGSFQFPNLAPGDYNLNVVIDGTINRYKEPLKLKADSPPVVVTISAEGVVAVAFRSEEATKKTGGEKLSSQTVSAIPLNKRDFSQLLLLAAGTMTDANGQTNFTQQFAINGQRGVEAVFAMDGADTSDPEMGGQPSATITSTPSKRSARPPVGCPLRLAAAQRASQTSPHAQAAAAFTVQSLSSYATQRSTRNYFDHPSIAEPGRIPPFRRNEFGFTNGGPIILPHIYNGSGKTFYFGEYQGFRQVLGTTQVLPVPTSDQRLGLDTTAFPGDTLFITPPSDIASILARYPLPNNPTGPMGPTPTLSRPKSSPMRISSQFASIK